jgi:TonB family protein
MKNLHVKLIFSGVISLSFAAGIFAQDAERENGVELYNKGNYKESVAALQKVIKAAPGDAEARTYLGMSQIKLGKVKDAEKSLGKSLELDPNQPNARKAMAYVLVLRGKPAESLKQMEALKALNAMDAESYYILGWAHLRLGNGEAALENADQSVKLNPKFANAYLLKAQAIMNRWNSPKDFKAIAEQYGTSAENIGKFIVLSSALPDAPFWRGQQETLKIFAAYYTEQEKNKNSPDEASANVTPLKILAKPRANYTDQARQAGVSGTIRLLVAFTETGKIENVLVLTSLGYGLDAQAIRAAKGIKYEPATRNGKAVTAVKTVEYTFTIY